MADIRDEDDARARMLFGCVTALLHADSSSALFTLPFAAIALYMIVGRFIYKRERKKSTAYAITTSRALVLTGRRSVIDMPIRSASIETREPRSDRHMNAIFRGDRSRPFGLFTRRAYYANTGLDFFDFFGERPVAFYDVADVLGLRAALLASRSDTPDRIPNA